MLKYLPLLFNALKLAEGIARVATIEADTSLTPEAKKAAVVAVAQEDLPILASMIGVPAELVAHVNTPEILGMLHDGIEAGVKVVVH